MKDAGNVNVALSELAGHVFAKSTDAFQRYSGEELDTLFEEIRLPSDVYSVICDAVVCRVTQLQLRAGTEHQQAQGQAPVDGSGLGPEQVLQMVSQLKALRSQLQEEISVLKSQLGGMQSASDEARDALKRAADANAQQQRGAKDAKKRLLQSEADTVAPSSPVVNYVLFAMIVVFAAMLCHKYFGPLMF